MKRLVVLGMSVLLGAGSAATLADRDYHGGHDDHGKHHWKHHGPPVKHHVYYYPRPYYPRPYYPRPYPISYNYAYPLGAALVGSAVTYSLYHQHNGVRCYEDHSVSSYPTAAPVSQVVGCHRIERFPDGSERRVELPLSECY